MPDDPKPLSPGEVSALEQRRRLNPYEVMQESEIQQLIATVRDRERKRENLSVLLASMSNTCEALFQERAELQRQLSDESPGTPLGRLAALGKWAEVHCGHDPASAKPCEAAVIEYVEELTRQLSEEGQELDKLLDYARKVAGRRDVHSVYEVLDRLAKAQRKAAVYDFLNTAVSPSVKRILEHAEACVDSIEQVTDAAKEVEHG